MTSVPAPEIPRPDLTERLLARARAAPPVLLVGPPGAGKTRLLQAVARALEEEGWLAIYLDLMGAASSPERFAAAALDALPAGPLAASLPDALEIRRLSSSGRSHGAAAVEALLGLWSSLHAASGRRVALLLDEATEIRSLAYFPGLRHIDQAFGAALEGRPHGTLLATSFPTLARRFWSWESIEARALSPDDLRPVLEGDGLATLAEAIVRASFGWPRYVHALIEALRLDRHILSCWVREMSPGGRLEQGCRATYESLLLRSRGYGISKAVLALVANEEGLNLTALVERLGRTPGATRDYLQWLVGVDALRMVGKRYYFVDGLLRLWVRLYTRGTPPTDVDLRDTALATLGELEAPSLSVSASTAATTRENYLIEID